MHTLDPFQEVFLPIVNNFDQLKKNFIVHNYFLNDLFENLNVEYLMDNLHFSNLSHLSTLSSSLIS